MGTSKAGATRVGKKCRGLTDTHVGKPDSGVRLRPYFLPIRTLPENVVMSSIALPSP
jgi:hypothetical protein